MTESPLDVALKKLSQQVESDQPDLETRLKFLGLTADDAQRVQNLQGPFERVGQQFADVFYGHLALFEQTAKFFQDPATARRLRLAQVEHLQTMLAAEWDENYCDRRRRVGDTHAELGVEPHFFLAAYCQYLQFGVQQIAEQSGNHAPGLVEDITSLLKVVLLDIGLTLDAYFAHSTHTLRNALDMLWKANTELRQFAHLASHDLKTPLATVANLCDEAIDEFGAQIPVEARELINAAKQRTYRMSDMINELLSAVTTVESEELNEQVDTAAVLDEVLDLLRNETKKKRIDIDVATELPSVWGNRVRLREAFYNLLSNAIKFIDKQPGRIQVAAHTNDGHTLFTISDNGPGIPTDELDRIFSPFRRLAQHRDKPGSGLGLYFTKNLIERQKGHVWAESEIGKGSRFCVLLPRQQA
jgi:signal transduction histidine kinase